MIEAIDGWKTEERDSMERAYIAYTSSPGFKKIEGIAKRKGFRVADAFERRNLSPKDLYSFAGGVWVIENDGATECPIIPEQPTNQNGEQ